MLVIVVTALVVEIRAEDEILESIHILKIVEKDKRALIKLPDGRNQVLKVGDSIGENGNVIEIVEGRVVIEERTDQGVEIIIIRFEKGKQMVERIKRKGDKLPVLFSPPPHKGNTH